MDGLTGVVVTLANVESLSPQSDFRAWDNALSKIEELQVGDWNKMTLQEKKAGTTIVCKFHSIATSVLLGVRPGGGDQQGVPTERLAAHPCDPCPDECRLLCTLQVVPL